MKRHKRHNSISISIDKLPGAFREWIRKAERFGSMFRNYRTPFKFNATIGIVYIPEAYLDEYGEGISGLYVELDPYSDEFEHHKEKLISQVAKEIAEYFRVQRYVISNVGYGFIFTVVEA